MRLSHVVAITCIVCIISIHTVHAANRDMPCSVRIDSVGNLLPVTYQDRPRSNPDGSLYPGDATHLLFKFSASHTCESFSLGPLSTSNGMMVSSALVISGGESHPRPHGVVSYEWIPKYLTTHNYYEILNVTQRCIIHPGGSRTCAEPVYELSELLVSFREDEELNGRDYQRVLHYKEHPYVYLDARTQSWHLAEETVRYNIGVDRHVLEDTSSVDAFVDTIRDNCTGLSENHGCIFGHIEVNTDTYNSDQICLFEELDGLGIDYNRTAEADECVKETRHRTGVTITGIGIHCDTDGRCKAYSRDDTASITPDVLYPNGEILFKYLQLEDVDGFPSKNGDDTYYLDNPIGIHGIPNAQFKEIRDGIISFEGMIVSSPISMIHHTTCNGICNSTISGEGMSAFTGVIGNGDMLSAHLSHDTLGISPIKHVSKMYNVGRYIGEFIGTAEPLVVVYDPQIVHTSTWSRLADAGYDSFENRYAIAISYAGSRGGGPDDGTNSTIHQDRPVKITDVSGVYHMRNSFGESALDWMPNASLSAAAGLDDLIVHQSIHRYIPTNHTFADSFTDPAVVYWNGTVRDVMIDSAGYARILLDIDIPQAHLDAFYINVTSHDTLSSRDYGGVSHVLLASTEYNFPWGSLSIPFNVTAYLLSENMTVLQDTDVVIEHINISDTRNDSEFIGAVEFYLGKHNSSEFAFMHMADMYDMNPRIEPDSHTALILLNKTGIHYDITAYNKAVDDGLLGGYFQRLTPSDILDMESREFFIEQSHYDVEISASRDGTTRTNIISMGGADLSNVIKHRINLHPENHIIVKKFDETAMILPDSYFGSIEELYVNGEARSDVTCKNGCLVFLTDDSPTEISVTNVWGGTATAKNVTGTELYRYEPESWIDVTPARLFWILLGLGVTYLVYRTIKMLHDSKII